MSKISEAAPVAKSSWRKAGDWVATNPKTAIAIATVAVAIAIFWF